eukprot:TRINITY_DN59364_c0_g1_i1.p1 TRINITY_DN59364_c0_g1~~TRINITY_DN59364_c0_g1_i1.p1  ORF type:complete len:653 (-),score=37.08 TRINITY_DN59364_c0_g1_i1:229-2187(-)
MSQRALCPGVCVEGFDASVSFLNGWYPAFILQGVVQYWFRADSLTFQTGQALWQRSDGRWEFSDLRGPGRNSSLALGEQRGVAMAAMIENGASIPNDDYFLSHRDDYFVSFRCCSSATEGNAETFALSEADASSDAGLSDAQKLAFIVACVAIAVCTILLPIVLRLYKRREQQKSLSMVKPQPAAAQSKVSDIRLQTDALKKSRTPRRSEADSDVETSCTDRSTSISSRSKEKGQRPCSSTVEAPRRAEKPAALLPLVLEDRSFLPRRQQEHELIWDVAPLRPTVPTLLRGHKPHFVVDTIDAAIPPDSSQSIWRQVESNRQVVSSGMGWGISAHDADIYETDLRSRSLQESRFSKQSSDADQAATGIAQALGTRASASSRRGRYEGPMKTWAPGGGGLHSLEDESEDELREIYPGAEVRLRGLMEDTWNGAEGTIESINWETGRCRLYFEDGRAKEVSIQNVESKSRLPSRRSTSTLARGLDANPYASAGSAIPAEARMRPRPRPSTSAAAIWQHSRTTAFEQNVNDNHCRPISLPGSDALRPSRQLHGTWDASSVTSVSQGSAPPLVIPTRLSTPPAARPSTDVASRKQPQAGTKQKRSSLNSVDAPAAALTRSAAASSAMSSIQSVWSAGMAAIAAETASAGAWKQLDR